jgi:HD-like signal output (HDOD) protein
MKAIDFLGDNPQIGTLPAAYTELSTLLGRSDVSIQMLSHAVSRDPALTAQLLRLANSAVYGSPGRIDSVQQAVTRLGTKRLRELALSTTVVRMFSGMPEHMLDMESYWRHSLATGICAQILGEQHLGMRTESLFAAGLMHDLGTLVLCVNHPRITRSLLIRTENSGQLLQDIEYDELGIDHAHLGGALMRLWGLPESLISLVEHHHDPLGAGPHMKGAAVIHLADVVVSALEYGRSGDQLVPRLDHTALAALGVNERLLEVVVKELDARFEDTVKALLN